MRFIVKCLAPECFVIWDRLTGEAAPYGDYSTLWEAEVVAWLRNRQRA
jgi:hypothetical protein